MRSRFVGFIAAGAALVLSVTAGSAMAAPMTFVGTNGSLQASATFDVSGSNLLVTLTNLDNRTFDATTQLVPSEVLTALFFDAGVTGLSPVGMTVASIVNATGVPGQNWQYLGNLSGAPLGATDGISSTGLGIMGPSGNFAANGQNLDGVGWGLVGPNYQPGTGNGQLPTLPLIQSSATFELSGLPGGFTAGSISNVAFQWGTNLNEPQAPGVPTTPLPEPSSVWLIGTGLLLMLGTAWRTGRLGFGHRS